MISSVLLDMAGVRKSYGPTAVLKGIDLTVATGAFVALVGQSGSGKTTLLKTINRLVTPDAGRVMLDGVDVATIDPPTLRRGIGYVFQGVGLFPHMTVAENIAITPRLVGQDGSRSRDRVDELLALVDLPRDFADRYPNALSGGQAQRVGVARALAARPRLMLMDEPFGALDPVTRATLADAYRALHRQLGLTSILVTHDMTEALLIADRVVMMDRGAIIADASPSELLAGHSDPRVAGLISTPRTQAERLAALRGDG